MMNVTSNPPLKIHAHGDVVPFRVLCASRLHFKTTGVSVVRY